MVGVKFTPIVPKKPIIDTGVPSRVDNVMRGEGGRFASEIRQYPPALPWKSRPPASGPRAGGRRTGALGRSWNLRFGRGWFEVGSAVGYSGFVQGFKAANQPKAKRQTSVMAARNWTSLSTVRNESKARLTPALRKAFRNHR